MGMKKRHVYDANNVEGKPLHFSPAGVAGEVTIRLDSGEEIAVPQNLLTPNGDGTCRFNGSFADWKRRARKRAQEENQNQVEERVVPIVEESVHVEHRPVDRGGIRVSRHVTEHTEQIDEPVLHDAVEIERVPIGRAIEKPVHTRREGDTTIIPVLEERLVVRKQLVLKEEIHVTRRTTSERHVEKVVLRSENADIEHIPPETGTDANRRPAYSLAPNQPQGED